MAHAPRRIVFMVVASIVAITCVCWLLLHDRSEKRLAEAPAEFRGTVTSDHGPVVDAVVRFKGEPESVVTNARGEFALSTSRLDANSIPAITASKAGYFIGSVAANANQRRIQLVALPERDNLDYRWVDPSPDPESIHNCGNCHRQIYDEWHGSGHATAATNRRFRNLYEGTDWSGKSHGDSLLAELPNGAGVCASCHAPGLSLDDPGTADMRRVTGVDEQGVHCDFCHKVKEVDTSALGLTHGRFAMHVLRPDEGQIFFGPLDDVDRGEDTFSPLQQESRYCAACHEGTLFGIHVYRTYSEWLLSPAASQGRACQSCHMTPSGQLTNIAPGHGGISRDPATLGNHSFLPGGRAAMLKRAVDLKVDVVPNGDSAMLHVQLVAQNVGHFVPTGFIDRHLVLVVEAFDGRERPQILDSKVRLPAAAGPELEGKSGRLFARLLEDSEGNRPVPFWRASADPEDTRLRPEEPQKMSVSLLATTSSVRIRLLYRRFWPATTSSKSWPDDTIILFDETRTEWGAN